MNTIIWLNFVISTIIIQELIYFMTYYEYCIHTVFNGVLILHTWTTHSQLKPHFNAINAKTDFMFYANLSIIP